MSAELPDRRHSIAYLEINEMAPRIHPDQTPIEEQAELAGHYVYLNPNQDSMRSAWSCYTSPPSSPFSPSPSSRLYSSDIFLGYEYFPAVVQDRSPHSGLGPVVDRVNLLRMTSIRPERADNDNGTIFSVERKKNSSNRRRPSRTGRNCSSARGSRRRKHHHRTTTFNLNPTYIPPTVQKMSVCSNGRDCGGPEQCNKHQLVSTVEYAETLERLKLAKEKRRAVIRRVVIGVSVTLTLMAVFLVTAFLAFGSKLEQRDWFGKENSGNGGPFVDETDVPVGNTNEHSSHTVDTGSPNRANETAFNVIRLG